MPEPVVTATTATTDASDLAIAEFFEAHPADKSQAQADPKAPVAPPAAKPEDTTEELDVSAEGESEEGEETGGESGMPAMPDGYLAVPAVTEGLATDFVMRDEQGAEIEVPALLVEYKANGKVRRDRIDQVVKMAQWGVYNQEREQALVAREAQAKEATKPIMERLTLREQQLEQLLQDEDAYMAARERYTAANTPEQQVSRLQEQLRQKEQETAQAQQATQAQAFLEDEVMPSLDTMAEALPEVSWDEMMNRLTVHMVPMMKNGRVPHEQYEAIRQYILHDLTPWAQQAHEHRSSRLTAAQKAAQQQTESAQVSNQRVKREVGRVLKPVGRSIPEKGGKTMPKGGHVSLDDAFADATANVLKGLNLS